ncbi:alpha/beta-hydrolase [Podospora fimiseda]|uniref:Alpha/beta-hydrolase n=1 Tax=Podospora fimiseda TaxID=252190 RepID=A0AAN7BZ58_9PEZI|nr:alpha/beta-hydrolase [Podospora fimiseda]
MSGGESNDIETMRKVQEFLGGYGAREDIVVPGFGMTETCAGAIFDTGVLENGEGKEVAGLGKCVPGIELRIMLEEGEEAKVNEVGGLELKGDIVFKGYWRNEVATKEAFREDGWFRTGDEAFIDEMGNLNLLGRKKGVVNINGIKIETGEVLKEIEKGLRECGLEVRVVCFASRGKGDITERITVGYFGENITDEERVKVDKVVVESCMMVTGAAGGKPIVFGVVGEQRKGLVPVSSLGKISGAKMRSLFEGGVFDEDVEVHREALERGRREEEEGELTELTELEVIVRKEVCGAIGIEDVGLVRVNDTFFDMGFTSIDLIQLKRLVDVRLETSVPAITFLQHPSVKKLATALVRLGHGSQTNGSGGLGAEYDPVVVFRPTGSKTPLWLIHPGVGEVLIFVRLAEQLAGDDRPIYALRTRGFELGQTPFSSIEETVETYISHIKIHQPNGPYALAGYCYGGMLAFEIAKKLNATSSLEQGVKFQGSFDLPPHIKDRMRQLGWNWCLLYLAQFVDAITEQQLEDEEELILKLSRDEAFDRVMGICKPERLEELGMDKKTLLRWVNVAYELHHIARDYEPSGMVHSIDVFHAYPLRIAAKTRDEWVNDKLSKWKDFCTTAPRFHEVGGEHYTMLGPDHVAGFAKILREALAQRGI